MTSFDYRTTNPFHSVYDGYTPMPEDLKKKWVEALRSGNYKKGSNTLYNKNTDRYCCLGVLCDIQDVDLKSFDNETLVCNYLLEDAIGPVINSSDTNEEIIMRTLASFNDHGYFTSWTLDNGVIEYSLPKGKNRFKQIANIIEKWL